MMLSKRIENMFSFLYAAKPNDPCHFDKDFLDLVKAAALRGASESETSTLKYTDAIVDAPRQLLAYAETPGRTLEGLRIFLRQCGVKFERCWPDWAYENGHLTKGGLAELVHRMMEDARG